MQFAQRDFATRPLPSSFHLFRHSASAHVDRHPEHGEDSQELARAIYAGSSLIGMTRSASSYDLSTEELLKPSIVERAPQIQT